jgi:hypothetical protein
MIIDIQDELEYNTTPSTTIITEQPPSPPQPQSPLQEITRQPQKIEPEPMQLDPLELLEHRPKITGPNPEVSSQQIIPFIQIQDSQPSKEMQTFPIPQDPSMQCPLSTINVESTIKRSGTLEAKVQKEA